MRTVDPLPAQISGMNKSTVLRLLGLLTGGNLLRRGTEVEVGVSRWTWSLLAKLPDRGELTSEEIGVVRELGKKAVLVGIGLKNDAELNEGMEEVEGGLDQVEEEDEPLDVVNDSSIATPSSPQHPVDPVGEFGSANTLLVESQTSDTNNHASFLDVSHPTDDLATAKARILTSLDEPVKHGVTLEEPRKQSATGKMYKWNTKATVDMILTVAGEVYGQRDLLEFRGTWDQVSGGP